jgi:predicted aspartyl protease
MRFGTFFRSGLLAMGLGAAVAGDADPVSIAPPPKSMRPVFLEFLNAPVAGERLVEVPRLAVGVAGALRRAVVDTGSTGVVLSAISIPGVDRLPSLGPGTITYSSSGRIMTGRWVVTPLVIAGRNAQVMTRPLPVLAVDAIRCTAGARRCTPLERPTGVAMLGIGFGREHDHQPGGTPDHNPLLNLAAISSRSYLISRQGISLGGDRSGFVLVRLDRDVAHQDWSAPEACITVGDGRQSCGTVLVDTGITGMFLTVPADRLPADSGGATSLPDGTAIAIDLIPAGSQHAAIGYVVHTGQTKDLVAPSSVILAGIGKRPTFVNTGVRLLNMFDYLYDADMGLVGYRPTNVQARP